MSKVLKIVAIVASVAAAAVTMGASLGISAALLSGVSMVASVGSSLLAKKKVAQPSAADRDRLLSTIDPRTPRKLVFGRTAMATDIRDQEFTGTNQEYLHRFIVVASHTVNSIQEIWFDDKLAWTSAGGVQTGFTGYLEVATRLEGNAGNAINVSARMGATRRYTGLAYVHLRFKLTGNSKKAESPFASAVPSRLTIIGEGMPCYDPRQDTTAGGSGAHRADDQSTWTYGTHARNPACQSLTYLLGWRIAGKLVVGKGIPARRFDMASFIAAANICDEPIALDAGGDEPRYCADFVISEADALESILGQFENTMDARFHDPQGRIALKCMVNDLGAPVASFTADDILGDVQWTPHGDLSGRYNLVRGTFTDPSTNSLYQSVDYPEVYTPSIDDIDRILPLDLPFVQSAAQAQRLAKRAMLRAQTGGGTLSCEMHATAWRAAQYDIVELSFPPLGFVNKKFRVLEIETRLDGVVPITLGVEDAAFYDWDETTDEVAAIVPVASTPYDPANNPLVSAVSAVEQSFIITSYVTDTDPADGLLQATDDSIIIESHSRTYGDIAAPLSITGTTLTVEDDGTTAIADATLYHIYYDDATRADTTPDFKATQNSETAANSGANPARHYVGSITTDVIGGTGTSGGGAFPPGWGGNNWYEN